MIDIIVGGLALLGIGGFLYESNKQKKGTAQENSDRQVAFGKAAQTLEKGHKYTVELILDPKDQSFGGINNASRAQQLIKATMQQYGWVFISDPIIMTKKDASNFDIGQPSTWVFQASWNRDEKFQTGRPGWLQMALPFEMAGYPGGSISNPSSARDPRALG